jgi:hypothetical protein
MRLIATNALTQQTDVVESGGADVRTLDAPWWYARWFRRGEDLAAACRPRSVPRLWHHAAATSRSRSTSRSGGAPKYRLYSRLKYEASS